MLVSLRPRKASSAVARAALSSVSEPDDATDAHLHGAGAAQRPRPARSPIGAERVEPAQVAPDDPLGGAAKRGLDILAASAALAMLLPLMGAVALVILLTEGRPIFIAHPRVGFGGRTFRCLKFRTMVRNSDDVLRRHLAENPAAARQWADVRKLTDDPRVTRVGHALRKTSLDELPQLFNILKGDMSCVGPRPVVTAEIERYGAHARHYLRATPGLTGLWQVSGRSSSTYRRRVVLDTLYARRWSLWLDVCLIAKTIPALLRTDETA
jgi:exopolysaccharide production protein ExoY